METTKTEAQTASETAVNKAKSAALAVEVSRAVQLDEALEKSAARTRETVLEVFREIFKSPDSNDAEQMTVVHSKIPILCVRVDAMDKKLDKLIDNQSWVVKIVVGAVLLGLLKLIFIP